jgi:putative acetyltransferase
MPKYPKVKDPDLIGEYLALVKSGGGYVWDDVLEYRVWCHPEIGAPDAESGNDYYYVFATYEEALKYSKKTDGAEPPVALVVQEEYIDEP